MKTQARRRARYSQGMHLDSEEDLTFSDGDGQEGSEEEADMMHERDSEGGWRPKCEEDENDHDNEEVEVISID